MRWLLIATMAVGWGCGEDFQSRSVIDEYRLIGIGADRPEAAPDDAVTLHAWDLEPNGDAVEYAWSVCLWSFGAVTGYACVDPAFEVPIAADGPTARVDFGPDGLDFRTFYATHGPISDASGAPLSLADGVEVYVRLRSGPDAAVHSVKRIRLRDAAPLNTNPTIVALTTARVDAQTVDLTVEVTGDSAEPFVDPLLGEARAEDLLMTWYTTAGELDPPVTLAPDVSTRLTLPPGVDTARIFVAVRDGRGGLAVTEAVVE